MDEAGVPLRGLELPEPPDFPVKWRSEEERRLLWRWDDIHSPLPATPMSASVNDACVGWGWARAAAELGLPSTGRMSRRFNGYGYSVVSTKPPSPEERRARDAALEVALPITRRRWDREFLPLLERDLQRFREVRAEDLPDRRLESHLDDLLEALRQHWRIHFLVVFPLMAAAERMAHLYRQILPEAPEEEAFLLLQGIDNKSLEVDRALQTLAEEARRRPQVAEVFRSTASWRQVIDKLSATQEGQKFLASLDDFLALYGYRPTGFDLVFPTWREDPSFVLLNVASYLKSPPRDLAAERRALAQEARQALERALSRIAREPERQREFLQVYRQASELWPLKEDHSFYIDQGSTALLRLFLAGVGRRLAARGDLAEPDDVFYLTLEELRALLAGSPPWGLSLTIRHRRQQRERFSKVIPPLYLGTAPADGVPEDLDQWRLMLGPGGAPAAVAEGASMLRGVPGSRGKVTGVARVVRSPAEFHKVRPGDVLVCTSTSPTWTPLFGSISALVSDSGGVLSHTAIVAREYGLPAVVGVRNGTRLIHDGQVVTVDGDGGLVRLH